MSYCCYPSKDRRSYDHIIQEMNLSDVQKQIIRERYIRILENFQKRARKHSYLFFMGHFMITVGSLFVPALLSIQNVNTTVSINGSSFSTNVYWATFIISLLVTMCNGLLTLFKVDKKYYFLHTTLERLRSEGWQYAGLTGRYSGHLIGNAVPTHQNQFVFFTHYIEKIKMKQVEEEYYKTDESNTHTAHASHAAQSSNGSQQATNELYPPSPDQPIHLLAAQVPEPVQEAVNSLILSRKTVEHRILHAENEVVNDINQAEESIHYTDKLDPPILSST